MAKVCPMFSRPCGRNSFVVGDANQVIQLILEGQEGRSWPHARLGEYSDGSADRRGVITFIRQSWGNQGEAVTAEMVAKNRKK